MTISIRPEGPDDSAAIRRVLEAAFPAPDEARLVALLRATGNLRLSLVAEEDESVVGHIAFSPVRVDGEADEEGGIGLAPLAVHPDFQRRGIGSRLIREGLSACERAGYGFVVVLGEPALYRRFGFDRADGRGLGNEYEANEAFMVLELKDGAIPAAAAWSGSDPSSRGSPLDRPREPGRSPIANPRPDAPRRFP